MRILFFTILGSKKLYVFRCIDNGEMAVLLKYLVKEAFHASTIGNKNICLFQSGHIARSKLVIMQAAGLRLSHVDYLDTFNATSNINSTDIHRIE